MYFKPAINMSAIAIKTNENVKIDLQSMKWQ